MAQIVKRGKDYWIDYRYPATRQGKRHRVKVGPSKEKAQILMGELHKEMLQGLHPSLGEVKPVLFEVVAQEYLDKHASQKRRPKTFKSNVDMLLPHFRGKVLQQITVAAVEDFKIARRAEEVEDGTINRNLAHLSGIFTFARRRRYFMGANPASSREGGAVLYDEAPGRARFLTGDEAAALVAKARGHLKDLILTALHTGGRLSEVLSLKRQDIDLDTGVLYFDQTNTKNARQREIPIDPELREVLAARLKVRSIHDRGDGYLFTWGGKAMSSVKTGFMKARNDAGLPGRGADKVTFHTLRHTFASWFMMNGGDIYRLQGYMGHQSIELTQRYAHLSPTHQREGVRYFGAPKAIGGQTVDKPAIPANRGADASR